jgi:membrane protease YdiL (CAAX protease family)
MAGEETYEDRARMLLKFFLLTFTLTWIAWFVAAAIPARGGAGEAALSIIRGPIFLLGVFAPAIMALALTARADGRVGVQALVRRIGQWRVSAGWYLFAAGYMVAIKLTVALVYRIMTGTWPRFGETPWPIMVIAIATSTWVQAGEEIGWRGYALPRLAAHIGLAPASVLLGVIWAVWHLPLFFVLGGDTVGQSFPLYVLQVTALSVAMAWLYWRTSGSLLLVMLMHAAVNNTKDIVPSAVPGMSNPFSLSGSLIWRLTIGLLCVGAAYFLFQMRAADLGKVVAGKAEKSSRPN